jgi:uncharacterized phage protein gp47/JayE
MPSIASTNGLLVPSYDETRQNVIDKAKIVFGDDIDTSETSVIGRLISVIALVSDDLLQALQGVYDASNPDNAQGVYLDNLAALRGFTRRPAQAASGLVTFSGTPGTVVPSGSLIQDANGSQFETDQEYEISGAGTIESFVSALTVGEIGTLAPNSIVTPIAGLDSVSDFSSFTEGRSVEEDYIFRARIEENFSSGSSSDLALRSKILDIAEVAQCLVISNRTSEVDANGLQPKSVNVYVYPELAVDVQEQVADIIFNNVPLGIYVGGALSFTVSDIQGYDQTVRFSNVELLNVDITVTINRNTSKFPTNGTEQIEQIVEWFFSGMSAIEAAENPEIAEKITEPIKIGAEIICSDIAFVIKTIPGIKTISVEANGSELLEIDFDQFPILNSVTVTYI